MSADAGNIIPLGVASTYGVSDASLTLANNNFRLSDTIPLNRDFSGSVTFSGAAATTTFTNAATVGGELRANANTTLGSDSADRTTFNSRVASDVIPFTTETHDLGSSTQRWNIVYTQTLNVGTTVTVPTQSIAPGSIDASSSVGQVLTTTIADMPPVWADPPIGVEMVRTLPLNADRADYPYGVLVSLIGMGTTANPPGIYRQGSESTTTVSWQRLGTVGSIITKVNRTLATGTSQTFGTNIAPAHLITIDGLTLVEGIDYNVDTGRAGFTLTTQLDSIELDPMTPRHMELINFSDVASLGDGEVGLSALATGALPSGITIPGGQVTTAVSQATSAGSATSGTFVIDGWTIEEDDSGSLTFSNGGEVRARLDTNGHFRAENDITAFDSL